MQAKPAILAPAGNLDILKNAVNAGSDGVYFGATSFNARRNAKNFSDADIIEGTAYAHLRGAKTYLTLNTIIYDEEIPEAVEQLKKAASAGIDGIIATDLGIIRLMRQITPSLPLNTSTQLSAHCASDCTALEALGASRIVLAREMSKEEIARAAQATAAKIKIFIHGAHCMCVSGQCYFSSALGERSGNRGLCAQVCRLPFSAEGGSDNGYALSLRDMSLISHIPELSAIGVEAMKIEGRMKSAGYVGVVVSAAIAAREGKWFDPALLRSAFSRGGFTDGYYRGELGGDMFGIRSEEDKREAVSAKAYENLPDTPRVGVRISYAAKLGEPFYLCFVDCDENKAEYFGANCEAAKKSALNQTELAQRLSKLGGSVYFAEEIAGTLEGDVFLPVSVLNAARRACCEKLNALRTFVATPQFGSAEKIASPPLSKRTERAPKLYCSFKKPSQINASAWIKADRIILPLSLISQLSPLLLEKYAAKIIAEVPRVFFGDEDILRTQLSQAFALGVKQAMCHTLGRIMLAREAGMSVLGGFGLNIANSWAIAELSDIGVEQCVISPELNFSRIERLSPTIPIGIFAYGRFPLMIMRNCPIKAQSGCKEGADCALIDRRGVRFPLKCDCGVTELFNSEPISLVDEPQKLIRLDFVLLAFSFETAKQAEDVIKAYRGESDYAPKSYTRGTYRRKLK